MKIEPSDGHDTHPDRLEQLGDGGTPLGIAQCAHHPPRLVQHDINERLGHQPIAVDLDLGATRVHAHAQLIDHSAVDFDAPLGDQLLGGAPRSNASTR